MTLLPDLERQLRRAADQHPTPASRGRWHRGSPLLAVLGALLVSGVAAAAIAGALEEGAPVPSDPLPPPYQPAPTTTFTLTPLRAEDPDGGLPWGVGIYDKPSPLSSGRTLRCVVVGRVQGNRLGIVGRDGAFDNDGKFHPLSPSSQSSYGCSGVIPGRPFVTSGFGPPIPASGYTGAPGEPVGGCRERVNLDGPTVSPQTRRRLRNVPECDATSLRRVTAGFAGPRARQATLAGPDFRLITRFKDGEDGAYLFVVRSSSTAPPDLSILRRDGQVCRPFGGDDPRDPQPGNLTLRACATLADP